MLVSVFLYLPEQMEMSVLTFSTHDIIKSIHGIQLRMNETPYQSFIVVRKHQAVKGLFVPGDLSDIFYI
jgi:hypothetical protein